MTDARDLASRIARLEKWAWGDNDAPADVVEGAMTPEIQEWAERVFDEEQAKEQRLIQFAQKAGQTFRP